MLPSALFCDEIIDFIQNFGNYSFCIYWTAYSLRIHYHKFESCWVALSKCEKIWHHYHSFSADVSIFSQWLFNFLLKNIFPLIFELLIPWTWLTPHFSAFWETYILITHWWPISISKTSNGVEWDWIMSHDVFFLKLIKSCWGQQKYLMKSSQGHNIWKQQYNSFLMGRYSSKSHKWFRNQNH